MDFNFSKCMQTATYFGHTDYHNVCNGIVHTVNWGTLDWITVTGLMAAGGALVFGLVSVALSMAKDIWNYGL